MVRLPPQANMNGTSGIGQMSKHDKKMFSHTLNNATNGNSDGILVQQEDPLHGKNKTFNYQLESQQMRAD